MKIKYTVYSYRSGTLTRVDRLVVRNGIEVREVFHFSKMKRDRDLLLKSVKEAEKQFHDQFVVTETESLHGESKIIYVTGFENA